MRKALTSVLVKPAGPDCNLACRYCFYTGKAALFGPGKHRMNYTVLEACIRQVMEQSPEQPSISWQGGEPTLMGLPFFEEAVRLERKYGEGKTIGNAFQTNGLLINDRWARFFRDNLFLVGLSIDGPGHVHDHYRRHANGSPSWASAMRAAGCLMKDNVAVNAVATVTRYSADYPEEIYGFLRDAGFTYMQFIPVVEWSGHDGRLADFSVTPSEFGDFLVRLFERWWDEFTQDGPAVSIRFFDAVFSSYVGVHPAECELNPACGTYVVIEHNGDVYPCDFFVETERRLGNVRDDTLLDLLNSPEQNAFGSAKECLPGACAACPWLSYCQGGCPKDRLRNPAGDGTGYFCESYRRFFEVADPYLRALAARYIQDRLNAPVHN